MPLASIEGGDLCKVWEIKTLGLIKDAEAWKLLEDVAKQVQPIMRKRKWKVTLLSEFCPNNPSLLGLNIDAGREIRIRLRKNRYDSQLFGYEETLGTMLHELTHIQCGPHNAAFYKLLDELTKECEELMVKGIKGTGQGFDARGQRLGGVTHNPPPSNLRKIALAAAEKRARVNTIMSTGPRRLGGDSDIMKALSPIQAAAMAAERRLKDDFWCAAPLTQGEDGMLKAKEREECSTSQPDGVKGSKDADVSEGCRDSGEGSSVPVIDVGRNRAGVNSLGVGPTPRLSPVKELDHAAAGGENRVLRENFQHSGVSRDPPVKKNLSDAGLGVAKPVAKRRFDVSNTVNTPRVGPVTGSKDEGSERNPIQLDGANFVSNELETTSSWECHICTLLNPPIALSCVVCGTARKQVLKDSLRTWTCKFCTLQNDELLANCAACDQWKYSYGAPTAMRAPNVGT